MDIQEIKQLIKIFEKSEIGEIEIVEEGKKIRISKNSKLEPSSAAANGVVNPVYMQPQMAAPPVASPPQEAPASTADVQASDKYYEVRSPMVGTYYSSPAPDAAQYVEVGDSVSAGQPLCIIEAMKLMNELESEYSGKIAKILVENAQPVEYNQVLFLIEK